MAGEGIRLKGYYSDVRRRMVSDRRFQLREAGEQLEREIRAAKKREYDRRRREARRAALAEAQETPALVLEGVVS